MFVLILLVRCRLGVCLCCESVSDGVVIVWYCDEWSWRLWRVCARDECGIRDLGLCVSAGICI